MSLIDQALKKTQSSLHQQNKPNTRTESVTPPPFTAQQIVNSLKTKKRFNMPEINKYWIVGTLSAAILVSLVFIVTTHFKTIEQRYTHFYKNIFSHPNQSLVLNGVIEMNNNRVALINGHLYHAGESIDGLQIAQIHYDHILLKNQATQQTQILRPTLSQ